MVLDSGNTTTIHAPQVITRKHIPRKAKRSTPYYPHLSLGKGKVAMLVIKCEKLHEQEALYLPEDCTHNWIIYVPPSTKGECGEFLKLPESKHLSPLNNLEEPVSGGVLTLITYLVLLPF